MRRSVPLWRLPVLDEQFGFLGPTLVSAGLSAPRRFRLALLIFRSRPSIANRQTVAEECAGVIFVAVDIGGISTDLNGFDDRMGRFIPAKSLTTPANLLQNRHRQRRNRRPCCSCSRRIAARCTRHSAQSRAHLWRVRCSRFSRNVVLGGALKYFEHFSA
jgi:hypothetical protein